MANTYLKGVLGFKGPRGYSAYEVAVQNGFIGTEKDWLAQIGAVNSFDKCSNLYTTKTSNESSFDLPDCYKSNSFVDVYVAGEKLNEEEYTINTSTMKIELVTPLAVAGTTVEIITSTMETGSLPIVETINETSTNNTAPGTKAVYDFVTATKEELNNNVESKLNNANIQVVTGTVANIGIEETKIVDIEYPAGFTKANTNIIGKMVSSNNNYYDVADITPTTSGFPSISMIALTDDVIRLWIVNTSTSAIRNGYYKITLLKR